MIHLDPIKFSSRNAQRYTQHYAQQPTLSSLQIEGIGGQAGEMAALTLLRAYLQERAMTPDLASRLQLHEARSRAVQVTQVIDGQHRISVTPNRKENGTTVLNVAPGILRDEQKFHALLNAVTGSFPLVAHVLGKHYERSATTVTKAMQGLVQQLVRHLANKDVNPFSEEEFDAAVKTPCLDLHTAELDFTPLPPEDRPNPAENDGRDWEETAVISVHGK